MAITVGGTSITFNDSTTQSTAATGTVTSVATGNGLSGGTITTTGTLVVACPSFNSVGSYCYGNYNNGGPGQATSGSNYSAGSGSNQIKSASMYGGQYQLTNNLSGTWKWMSGTSNNFPCGGDSQGVICRVS